jgi:hypothetical protein
MPPRLTRTTGKELGPSLWTQSTCRHPVPKTPYPDASAAAILLGGGRYLLTLAPTRRVRAPLGSCAQERKLREDVTSGGRLSRPLTGALYWLSAGDLARSVGGAAAGVSARQHLAPPRPCLRRGLRLRLRLFFLPPPPLPCPGSGRGAAAQTVSRGRRDPHGKMAAADPDGRAGRLRGAGGLGLGAEAGVQLGCLCRREV